jgi:hypothetical protein
MKVKPQIPEKTLDHTEKMLLRKLSLYLCTLYDNDIDLMRNQMGITPRQAAKVFGHATYYHFATIESLNEN